VKFNDALVGRHPLCLTVKDIFDLFLYHFLFLQIHENGSFRRADPIIYLNVRSLSSKNAAQTPIEYLLQYLQTSVEMFTRQRPKRVFDLNGIEIKQLGQLKSKQHLFISYGEDYRPAFGMILFFDLIENFPFFLILEPCLAIQLHSVKVYEKNNALSLVKTFRTEDELIGDKEKRSARYEKRFL
jgi:hypothetical protein